MAEKKVVKKTEVGDFVGHYVSTIGRRKTAVATVRLYENGKGVIMVNGEKPTKYFDARAANLILDPLKLTGKLRDFNLSIIVVGGGKSGQAEAVRHAIARALVKVDETYKPVLRAADLMTRDRREVERKHPGHKKARKSGQWSKR